MSEPKDDDFDWSESQWSQFIPREKPTFEYHDLDIHYEIPKEVLQLQIYDYYQWISKNKEV